MDSKGKEIDQLIEVMDKLLSPQGCPWDREQTHESLCRYLLEESYEAIEAIKNHSMNDLQEELGDVLLQVVFHAALAERAGFFNFTDVVNTVKDKMIGRHPHVFASMKLESSEEVMTHWEKFKRREGKKTVLEGIPLMLPALMRAEKLQEKAARVGFDWPSPAGAIEKFKEEIEEFKEAESQVDQEEEMGDILFAMVNVARLNHIESEQALQASNDKFTRRFDYMEDKIIKSGRSFEDLDLEALDLLWDEAKEQGL